MSQNSRLNWKEHIDRVRAKAGYLNTLNDREDQNCEENERAIRPKNTLKKLEQIYMKEQRDEENYLVQKPS